MIRQKIFKIAGFKKIIMAYWNKHPCHINSSNRNKGDQVYFKAVEQKRYADEPFIKDILNFDRYKGMQVLDIGCGMGIDLLQFTRSGAVTCGVDISLESLKLAKENLKINNHKIKLVNGDVERLPFLNNSFEFAYSWGCIHHTQDVSKAIDELFRILKPNGKFCMMVYHKFSLAVFRLYIRHCFLKIKPFMSFDKLIAEKVESYGTKAFTIQLLRKLLKRFSNVNIKPILTKYDLVISQKKDLYIPNCISRFIPDFLGWFIVVTGEKTGN